MTHGSNAASALVAGVDAAMIDLDGTLVDTLGDFTEALGRMLADQGLVVERMEWMRNSPCPGHQLLVLTDEAPQGTVDLAVHALQALPKVAGPCVQWRVELLAG